MSVSRLASIRQGLPSPARRSPVPRSRALWIEAPDAHTIGPACERSLAAIRQVSPQGAPLFPPRGPPFDRVAFTGGSGGCALPAGPASRRGHGDSRLTVSPPTRCQRRTSDFVYLTTKAAQLLWNRSSAHSLPVKGRRRHPRDAPYLQPAVAQSPAEQHAAVACQGERLCSVGMPGET